MPSFAPLRCASLLLACTATAVAAEPPPPALLPMPAVSANEPVPPPLPGRSSTERSPLQNVAPRRLIQIPTAPPAPEAITVAPPAPEFDLEEVNAGRDIRPLRDTTIQLTPTLPSPENPAASVYHGSLNLTPSSGWISRVDSYHAAYVPYQPLYFEEENLERYGYNCGCFQPVVSAVKFYGTLPLLPYKMTKKPPCSYESNLELPPAATAAAPVPCRITPIDLRAVTVEAAAITAVILLVP